MSGLSQKQNEKRILNERLTQKRERKRDDEHKKRKICSNKIKIIY